MSRLREFLWSRNGSSWNLRINQAYVLGSSKCKLEAVRAARSADSWSRAGQVWTGGALARCVSRNALFQKMVLDRDLVRTDEWANCGKSFPR